jgi:hypothetical protein
MEDLKMTTTYVAKVERANGTSGTAVRDTYKKLMAWVNEESNANVKIYKLVNGKVFCQMKVK